MQCRWLGWAGVELEYEGERLVIDPLADAAAVFSALGERAATVPLPQIVAPLAQQNALAGLVTHLHRDHADAAALQSALSPGAPLLAPHTPTDDPIAAAALRQAATEIGQANLAMQSIPAWKTVEIGPFAVTALPAADGTGDPQLSWAVAAGAHRIIHCGDTMFHGWWWRSVLAAGPFDAAFVPINGAVVEFPWRTPASPFPAVMGARDAALAAHILGATQTVGIHYGGYEFAPLYRGDPDAAANFVREAKPLGVAVSALEPGGVLEL